LRFAALSALLLALGLGAGPDGVDDGGAFDDIRITLGP
jgi:hypothetical protein